MYGLYGGKFLWNNNDFKGITENREKKPLEYM